MLKLFTVFCFFCWSHLCTGGTICDSTGGTWWCAQNYTQGQSVISAVQANSCFCVMNKTQTVQQASTSCSSIGSFLTDIQNAQENTLIQYLMNQALNELGTSASNSGGCPASTTNFNGKCYAFVTTSRSWSAAEQYCATTYGGHLASVQSPSEQAFLYTLANKCSSCPDYGLWVGGNNYGNPDNWIWSDGSAMAINSFSLTNYTGWPKQPDDPKNQQCMVLVKPDGGWADWTCSWSLPSICSFPAMPATALIGLQQNGSGLYWSIGNNCNIAYSASFQNLNSTLTSGSNTAFVYSISTGTWLPTAQTSTSGYAVCRKDLNICGRTFSPPCPSCTPTNGGQCFICNTVTVAPTSSPVTVVPICNPSGITSASNWYCAKDNAQGQMVTTAVQADSCFCVMQKNQTMQQAYDSCQTTGGFLMDVQNEAENILMETVLKLAYVDPTVSSTACPPPSVFYNGMCYSYESILKSWQQAESYCSSTYNGHLASIHSAADQAFLYDLSKRFPACYAKGFWVGGNNYGVPNVWKWSDNTTNNFMPSISAGEPGWLPQPDQQNTGPNQQNCMTLCKVDGGWADWLCSYTEPFVCSFSAKMSSAWIGLQKSGTLHSYAFQPTCPPITAVYQGWNFASESPSATGYVYSNSATPWLNLDANTIVPSAICRKDKSICGRKPCQNCSSCTATNNGMCFQCSSLLSMTVPPVSINSNALTTTAGSLMCNSVSGLAWNWCAKDYKEGQTVISALQSDSCFCVMNKSQTQQQAFDSCAAIGGFLTDIQNSAENTMLSTFVSESVAASSSNSCPGSAQFFNGMCYAYVSTRKSWVDAENYCVSTYSGHLASVSSVDEQNFLHVTMTKNCTGCQVFGFWVGGNNYGTVTNWKWSDGKPMQVASNIPYVTSYAAWPKQPDNPTNQQCITLVQPDGGWADWYCTSPEEFVCSFAPLQSQTAPWIGLTKTSSGSQWNVGKNCKVAMPTYTNIKTSVESPTLTSYVMESDGFWVNTNMATVSNSAICRLDRNLCGRSPCPQCSTCTLTNNGQCYSCS